MIESIRLPELAEPVSRIALGGCPFGGHGWGAVDDTESVTAVRAAVDAGVTFFDTADVYGLGHSEELLSLALAADRHRVTVATKFGVRMAADGQAFRDVSPAWARSAVEASLRRLRLERIPLYYMHWPDGKTCIEDVIGALADLRDEGKIGAIGLSNVTAAEIQRATQVATISAVQVQYSLVDRYEAETLLQTTRRLSIPLITWGSLAQGLLTGKYDEKSVFPLTDRRSRYENFQHPKLAANMHVVRRLRKVAATVHASPGQVAIRWLLDQSGVGAVLFGAKNVSQVAENVHALSLPPLPKASADFLAGNVITPVSCPIRHRAA
jgi:aryl-alcohol dehydrogenase-like predicted oxidoreductase